MKLKKQLIKIIIKKKLPTEDKGNICNKKKKQLMKIIIKKNKVIKKKASDRG